MQNIGEELCGEYLYNIKNCEFITYNITNPDIQGEIDVIGINLQNKTIYVCEVAVHTSGLHYVKNGKPDNYNRFVTKFDKDIVYVKKYFSDFKIVPMLWSPIVQISGEKAKYNAFIELQGVKKHVAKKHNLDLQLIINEKFLENLDELKNFAGKQTAELKPSVTRVFQIENSLKKHIERLRKRNLL